MGSQVLVYSSVDVLVLVLVRTFVQEYAVAEFLTSLVVGATLCTWFCRSHDVSRLDGAEMTHDDVIVVYEVIDN